MKKLTSKEPITLRIDGNTVLEIGPKGCIATDEAAAIAVERLGENVSVAATSIKKAVEDAKASLKAPEEEVETVVEESVVEAASEETVTDVSAE